MNLKGIKPAGLILIVLALVAVVCLFSVFGGLGNLLRGAGNVLGSGGQPGQSFPGQNLPGRNLPNTGSGQAYLGRLYTAASVDRNGCPAETTNQFNADETVYAGLEQSTIPRNTELFIRLYYNGQPVEDTDPIQANQDLQSCVWFKFQPDRNGFQPGNYEAELIVNGNPVDSTRFQVANGISGGFPGPGQSGGPVSSGSSTQVGTLHATTQVDANGCPQDSVSEFYQDEPVYISTDESYIASGTEIFARLEQNGQAVEDTDPIYADQDMQSCVWFQFQSNGAAGLNPGDYQAVIYVNGYEADSVQFSVR